jgi:hypothetical protein
LPGVPPGHGDPVCVRGVTWCGDGTPLSDNCRAKGCDKCGSGAQSNSFSGKVVDISEGGHRRVNIRRLIIKAQKDQTMTETGINTLFLNDVRAIIADARKQAYATVNFIMVEAYWRVGMRIVREEQSGNERADYGRRLIRELSRRLGDEFGRGFSTANLWNFRQFYLTFPTSEKLYALRRELTWTHYRLIMRVEKPAAREYYITEAADQNWSTRELERNIASDWYERLLFKTDGRQ